jgi:hypothetical protein
MSEQLLTPIQAARKLGISRAKFYVLRASLIARGMKRVTVGSHIKYLESSLEKLIQRAAENGKPLC